ncbi:heterokaryon incompatibility protein-domain-containing protein [Podospora aff. communis PSN243]|uniref:Heterokaryon incompatibility protein-domain-containing protein n=1 Tax=Podospora aff. communis PSN243 TaxID=3040156 RepID=A0AAV9H3K3_9PEZI|nr:heterokaryon incompatibility protein-domain-containing protein [Podospora aff. communis PSN243]
MRLINVDTLELVDFCGRQPQAYAILSHTWGDEEVSFQDIQNLSRAARKRGFRKIEETCRLARARGLGWAWVDTCCIDKSSSAELSEAINSMFQWYQRSCVCFAYLEDVDHAPLTLISIHESLPKSRWFKRGWTLQELLGPSQLLFYDSTWAELGLREHLSSAVSEITNIDESFLSRPSSEDINNLLARASIAERMSWASRRSTSREEDGAYCLLGIFGINIPLLYGEGPRAFLRLQEEIIKRSNDQSIFAPEPGHVAGLLASSPACISQSADIVPRPTGDSTSIYTITNKGLHINLPMLDAHAVLACGPRDDPTTLMTLQLSKVDGNLWQRSVDRGAADLGFVDQRAWQQWTKTIQVGSSSPVYSRPLISPPTYCQTGITGF